MEIPLNDSYYEPFSVLEQNLRKSSRKKTLIGIIVMLLSLIAVPILGFYIQFLVPPSVVMMIFVIIAVIVMTGLAIVFWYGKGASLFFLGLDLLKKLSPPDPIITGRYVVIDKSPVYGIGKWASNLLFFVAFYTPERVFHEKVEIPGSIWKWEFKLKIGDIKVSRREGVYTIPIGPDEYYTGEGILYALLLEGGVYIVMPRDYSSEQLQQIVANLEAEVTSYGSSKSDFDDQDY